MRSSRREQEFTEFVAARRTHLRRLAFGICGDWHQADDLVQTALIKLYQAWPRMRREGQEEAYVRRILVRAQIDETRRPWRRETTAEHLPDRPAREGVQLGDREALLDALQALPVMQRRTVLLRYWLGLSVAETAAELGISDGTVKSHSARPRRPRHQALGPDRLNKPTDQAVPPCVTNSSRRRSRELAPTRVDPTDPREPGLVSPHALHDEDMRSTKLIGDARRAWVSLGATLGLGFAVGFVLPFLLSDRWLEEHELAFNAVVVLAAFSLYCAGYSLLTWRVLRRLEGEDLRAALARSAPRDRAARVSRALSGGGAGAWSVSAALTALGLAVALAFVPELRAEPSVLALTAVTVVSSWLLVPTSYAVEYLREDADSPGLVFPGERELCFANYFYLAVQISTTFSSSDVEVTTVSMRRRVTTHSLLAFVFSSVVIALVVSAILTAAPR